MVELTSSFTQSPVALAQHFLAGLGTQARVAVDATAGKGGDTAFLAKLVGVNGKVYAFDVQEEALIKTRQRLQGEGLVDRVELIHAGHESMTDYINEKVDLIMFNLGYLPGGDHDLITKPGTTLDGIKQGLRFLKPGGAMSVVIYPGHPGGRDEGEAVEHLLTGLSKEYYKVLRMCYMNRLSSAPYLVLVEKSLKGEIIS